MILNGTKYSKTVEMSDEGNMGGGMRGRAALDIWASRTQFLRLISYAETSFKLKGRQNIQSTGKIVNQQLKLMKITFKILYLTRKT
jgi:hypothetical protein